MPVVLDARVLGGMGRLAAQAVAAAASSGRDARRALAAAYASQGSDASRRQGRFGSGQARPLERVVRLAPMHRQREQELAARRAGGRMLSRSDAASLAQRAAARALRAHQREQEARGRPLRHAGAAGEVPRRQRRRGARKAEAGTGAAPGPSKAMPAGSSPHEGPLEAAVQRAWEAVEGCLRELGDEAAVADGHAQKLRAVLQLLQGGEA